jgi:hypothetical protein
LDGVWIAIGYTVKRQPTTAVPFPGLDLNSKDVILPPDPDNDFRESHMAFERHLVGFGQLPLYKNRLQPGETITRMFPIAVPAGSYDFLLVRTTQPTSDDQKLNMEWVLHPSRPGFSFNVYRDTGDDSKEYIDVDRNPKPSYELEFSSAVLSLSRDRLGE